MIVGFMRHYKNPIYIAKLLSLTCKYHNIELIYFRPQDVNMEKDIVKGKIYVDDKWKTAERPLPKFIDISPYCFKHKKLMNYLRDKTVLSDDGTNVITKEKLQKLLRKDNDFASLVIPTHPINNFGDLEYFLKQYQRIVLKPIKGERGKNVYSIIKENDAYFLGYKIESTELSLEKLKDFYDRTIKDKGYILQKYISSRTLQGDPLDCRIHVQKNGEGKWAIARMYFRIGLGQKVISNVNQGGYLSNVVPFLKANFSDNWENIHQRLKKLAINLPKKIEELKEQDLMLIGMDIAIDSDGELYLFEANSAPGVKYLKSEVGILRADYYKYVLDRIKEKEDKKGFKLVEKQNFQLKKDINLLKKQLNKLQREVHQKKKQIIRMENSTSWKITKPMRKISGFIKRIK